MKIARTTLVVISAVFISCVTAATAAPANWTEFRNQVIDNGTLIVEDVIGNISYDAFLYLKDGKGDQMPEYLFNELTFGDAFIKSLQTQKRDGVVTDSPIRYGFGSYDRIIAKVEGDNTTVRVSQRSDAPAVPSWVSPSRIKAYTLSIKFWMTETARVWFIENWYDTKAVMIDNATGIASLGVSVASEMKTASGKECKGYLGWHTVDGIKWTCAVSAWTTGGDCYTTATAESLASGCDEAVQEANQRDLVGYCVNGWNGGTFHADVRILHPEVLNANVWDFSC